MKHHTTEARTSTDREYDSQVVLGSQSILAPASALRSETDETTVRVAFHEAGHAIGSVAYGVLPHLISIVPNQETLGRALVGRPPELRSRLAIIYCGPTAETLRFKTHDISSWLADTQAADELLGQAGFSKRRRSKPWTISVNRNALEDAQRITKRFAGAIRRTANLLMDRKELSGDEVARVVADCGLSCALLGV